MDVRMSRRARFVAFAAGACVVWAAVGASLSYARQWALANLATPDAERDWQQWRKHSTDAGPVSRRAPRSSEPPQLALLRDHFPVCLASSLVVATLIYGALALFAYGALRRSTEG
jgi:hypothetical protein